jgi:hypothetical protein
VSACYSPRTPQGPCPGGPRHSKQSVNMRGFWEAPINVASTVGASRWQARHRGILGAARKAPDNTSMKSAWQCIRFSLAARRADYVRGISQYRPWHSHRLFPVPPASATATRHYQRRHRALNVSQRWHDHHLLTAIPGGGWRSCVGAQAGVSVNANETVARDDEQERMARPLPLGEGGSLRPLTRCAARSRVGRQGAANRPREPDRSVSRSAALSVVAERTADPRPRRHCARRPPCLPLVPQCGRGPELSVGAG